MSDYPSFFSRHKKLVFSPIAIFVTSFFAAYGALWGVCDSRGYTYEHYPAIPTFLWVTSFIFALTSFFIRYLIIYQKKNRQLIKELYEARSDLELLKTKQSFCCVKQQNVPKCPVGITKIHEEMQATLVSSILEAKKSFKYLGLSGFATLHNNVDCFNHRNDVEYHFLMSNPENMALAQANDKWFKGVKGRIDSKTLIDNGHDLIKKIKGRSGNKITFNYINQIPSFRIINIDDNKLYVSFYEPHRDAMKTTQLEIEEDENQFNLFNWFKWYVQKVQINENLNKTK